ncbi:hypothetical protein [Methanohalobium evestigatum]|uniref:hypothetical protein n=1 Tax=Methanohalobium evestigatum TaxID=2322 RepID=UPI0012F6770F|nr:hypothetical protein [Methanohalobium evestigatum]
MYYISSKLTDFYLKFLGGITLNRKRVAAAFVLAVILPTMIVGGYVVEKAFIPENISSKLEDNLSENSEYIIERAQKKIMQSAISVAKDELPSENVTREILKNNSDFISNLKDNNDVVTNIFKIENNRSVSVLLNSGNVSNNLFKTIPDDAYNAVLNNSTAYYKKTMSSDNNYLVMYTLLENNNTKVKNILSMAVPENKILDFGLKTFTYETTDRAGDVVNLVSKMESSLSKQFEENINPVESARYIYDTTNNFSLNPETPNNVPENLSEVSRYIFGSDKNNTKNTLNKTADSIKVVDDNLNQTFRLVQNLTGISDSENKDNITSMMDGLNSSLDNVNTSP